MFFVTKKVSCYCFRVINQDIQKKKTHYWILFSSIFRPHSLQRVKKTENYLLSLPAHHQKLLTKYREHLQEVKLCIENNDEIIKLIIKDVSHIFENVNPSSAHNDSVRKVFMGCCMFIKAMITCVCPLL